MATNDKRYDVIVVGFGDAGASAAIAAAEGGASVLVLDRGYGGGASALSGGVVYTGGGSKYQKEAGYDETPDNMFRYLQQEVKGVVDDETLRDFCDTSVERLEWLEKHGAKFNSALCTYKTSYPTDDHYLYFSGNEKAYPYNTHADPAPRGHRQVAKGMSSGAVLWGHLRDSALKLGVVFEPLSRVEELIIEDGLVVGVRYRTVPPGSDAVAKHGRFAKWGGKLGNWVPPVGKRLNAAADKVWQGAAQQRTARAGSVILAAGGFVFNRDMVRLHGPQYDLVSPLGTEGDDGKGIELGVSAGGSTDHLERMTAWRFLSPPSAMLEGVTVGVSGERIANEDLYGATHSEILIHKFGGRGFLIVDSATWKKAKGQIKDQTQPFQRAQLMSVMGPTGHRKAATLEALAGKLGISASGLKATVDAYNEGIASGAGDPAHKAADLCAPVATGPFYGIDISVKPSLAYFVPGLTLGGLRVDGKTGLVLDEGGNTIPGLYAAGRTAVGVCSNSYVSGLALADCVFSGKRAGTHAAAQASVTVG